MVSGSDNEISVPLSAFADPAGFAPGTLEAYYDWAHQVPYNVLLDAEKNNLPANTYPVVSYSAVRELISSPATPRDVTLAPFPPYKPHKDLGNMAAAVPDIMRAMFFLPKATANSTGAEHEQVLKATFTDKDNTDPLSPGLSRNHQVMQARYGELVSGAVDASLKELLVAVEKDGVVDLAADFASPLAARVISRLVGFSSSDEEKVKGWSDAQTDLLGRILSPHDLRFGIRGLMSLYDACRHLVQERRREPAHDLASYIGQSDLSDKKVAAILMNLMAAGYSTSYGSNLNIIHRLLADPEREHWHALAEPTGTDTLVTELLRLDTALIGWKVGAGHHKAMEGIPVPGKGVLLLMLGAANRDPRYFPDPHAVRPGRKGLPLTFGLGKHMCMGKDVALMETTSVLRGLSERLPDLVLARPPEHITYGGPDMLFRTLSELLVRRAVAA